VLFNPLCVVCASCRVLVCAPRHLQVYEATSEAERQRQNAIHEFVKTELAFRDDLDMLLSQCVALHTCSRICADAFVGAVARCLVSLVSS
jgi:formate hydrogenlyase subunit 6/NADH:ubiquinone oxidoreductase subunit I